MRVIRTLEEWKKQNCPWFYDREFYGYCRGIISMGGVIYMLENWRDACIFYGNTEEGHSWNRAGLEREECPWKCTYLPKSLPYFLACKEVISEAVISANQAFWHSAWKEAKGQRNVQKEKSSQTNPASSNDHIVTGLDGFLDSHGNFHCISNDAAERTYH